MEKNKKPEWLCEFERVSGNAVYFLELYYNVAYPDKAVNLSDEEKQEYFDQYRKIPVFKTGGPEAAEAYIQYHKKINELKEQGHKDWEIF
jgi:ABC-type sulfate transport system substrate-binding protein